MRRYECKIRYQDTYQLPCVSSVPQSALDSCTPREAEEEAASVRAEAAAAQSQLRKATAYASSLTAARAVADEKRASCARRQIAWPRLSRTKEMARGKGGASQILQNLSKICLCEWRFA